ncbi:carbohydrate ABC transporter permease [Streptomyces sp. NPDC057690]|uniref:carbohydrate ABC transporter permease n=1 Tax=Streptomyces sp. NPDC057690 TaxID=3346214 RepID=UPI0036B783D0
MAHAHTHLPAPRAEQTNSKAAKPVSKRGAPAPAPRRARTWRLLTPWLFLLAPLVLLVTFTYAPIANMVAYSFTDWDGVSPELHYTGAENYTEIFTREDLFQVFWVSGYYLVASVIQIVAALYFATILSFSIRFRNFFKGVLFFPSLVNGVAIGFVFLYFFQDGGTFDTVLGLFGYHTDHAWLGTPASANTSLAGVSIWRYLGMNFVLFLGAIQSIPGELYEAAELDGAGRWHQFRYIILPGIKPVLTLTVILSVSGSLSAFEIPYIMTGGATGTETFVIQTVKLAFQFNKTGLASAAAVVLLLIILLVTWVQRRLVPDDRVDLV